MKNLFCLLLALALVGLCGCYPKLVEKKNVSTKNLTTNRAPQFSVKIERPADQYLRETFGFVSTNEIVADVPLAQIARSALGSRVANTNTISVAEPVAPESLGDTIAKLWKSNPEMATLVGTNMAVAKTNSSEAVARMIALAEKVRHERELVTTVATSTPTNIVVTPAPSVTNVVATKSEPANWSVNRMTVDENGRPAILIESASGATLVTQSGQVNWGGLPNKGADYVVDQRPMSQTTPAQPTVVIRQSPSYQTGGGYWYSTSGGRYWVSESGTQTFYPSGGASAGFLGLGIGTSYQSTVYRPTRYVERTYSVGVSGNFGVGVRSGLKNGHHPRKK